METTAICTQCGGAFAYEQIRRRRLYCSTRCRRRAAYVRQTGEFSGECEHCGRALSGQRRRYCDRFCQMTAFNIKRSGGNWPDGKRRECPVCSNTFVAAQGIQAYCSRRCYKRVDHAKQTLHIKFNCNYSDITRDAALAYIAMRKLQTAASKATKRQRRAPKAPRKPWHGLSAAASFRVRYRLDPEFRAREVARSTAYKRANPDKVAAQARRHRARQAQRSAARLPQRRQAAPLE